MKLRLYISGSSRLSERAVAQAKRVCLLIPDAELEVVNLEQNPDEAEQNSILTMPTLSRIEPIPERRVVGDMDDPVQVAAYLIGSRG